MSADKLGSILETAMIKDVPGSTIYTIKSLILEIIASMERASLLTKFLLPLSQFQDHIKDLENWQEKLLWECRDCLSSDSFTQLNETLQKSVQEFQSLCKVWHEFEAKVCPSLTRDKSVIKLEE
jgi:predicted nucleotide-binding protein (sugar kinase/HSP70/actin superfamily)